MNTLPSSVNAAGRLAAAALLGTWLAATALGQAFPSWQQEQAYSGGQFRLQTTGAPSPAPLGPKKPGVPRIGVLDPKAQMGQGSSVLDVAAPVRQAILAYLEGPVVEVVPIVSRVEIQVAAEAKQKECDYLLQTTVTKGHAGGGWRKTLGSVAPLTAVIPVVGMAGSAAGAVAATAGTAAALGGLSAIAATTRAKDEVKLDFALIATGDHAVVLTNTSKRKAKTDGEDVLSPLIEEAASAILTQVTKR